MLQLKSDKISITIDEKEITFETGKIARQANGAVILTCGETVILATACAAPEPTPDTDFFPLRVDYQEKSSSAGRTLGGFIKREGKPSEREILTSRFIDRPLRPMFPEGYYNEVQVLAFVMSYDGVNLPDPLAICAASAALTISDIPLIKPIAGVRVGLINGKYIVNPTFEEKQNSSLDLVIAGTDDAVLMIEGYCDFLTEAQALEAIEIGHAAIRKICEALKQWQQRIGKPKNLSTIRPTPQEVYDAVHKLVKDALPKAIRIPEKKAREQALSEVKQTVKDNLMPEGSDPLFNPLDIFAAHKAIEAKYMREMVLKENRRCDGRKTDEIRPIYIEQGVLPRTHGSSLFTRGETQAIAVCTLGGEQMAQRFEDLHGENASRFYLQYSFPPFSVGEVGRMGPPGRREVGHGKLAERAIQAALPSREAFPYIIRLESNITESNGSSSMATVCGCCLALMDAGVPVKGPIAGIAMGLILEGSDFRILSDILGVEDALGDMDFKVAGDINGITAFQMDIKVEGITTEIMRAALEQAKRGREHILGKMKDVAPSHRSTMSAYAPRIETIQVKPSKIGTIIGPGGKQIRAIVEETGVQIDIDDNGLVNIASNDLAGIEKAKEIINGLIAEVEPGKIYNGTVVSVVDFGAFVEILPGKEGLCHISEFDHKRIAKMSDVVKPGDKITVKVLEINDRGQVKLSRRVTLPAPAKQEKPA